MDLKMKRERELLTVEETADILNLSRSRVYELLASERLPSIRIGRSRRIRLIAIQEFITSLEDGSVERSETSLESPVTLRNADTHAGGRKQVRRRA